ncbi:MAG: hypothetical protein ACRD50_01595 [Candidatus Acidiferrales bacterium]
MNGDEMKARTKTWRAIRIGWQVLTWAGMVVLVYFIIQILRTVPPPPMPSQPDAAQSLAAKLRDSEAAAGRAHELALTAAEVNSFLRANLSLESGGDENANPAAGETKSNVREVEINFVGDLAQIYLVFDLHGKNLSIWMEGRLGVRDGYLDFAPVDGKLGSLTIPRAALGAGVTRMLASQRNREQLQLPREITEIHVENGKLVIGYH